MVDVYFGKSIYLCDLYDSNYPMPSMYGIYTAKTNVCVCVCVLPAAPREHSTGS